LEKQRVLDKPSSADLKEATLQQAGKALAQALGPVHELFGAGDVKVGVDNPGHFFARVPLRALALGLSFEAMDVLLQSEALMLRSENEAYYFLGAWLYQSCPLPEQRMSAFKRLVKHIRFNRLSTDFLANCVSYCPLATTSSLLPFMMRSGLVLRNVDMKMALSGAQPPAGEPSRRRGKLEWVLESHLPSADLLLLDKGESLIRHLGLAGGYPVALYVKREREGDTLGVYVRVYMPVWEVEGAEDVIDGVGRGMGFECCVRLSDRSFSFTHYFKGDSAGFGWMNFFLKPWGEVVHVESALFNSGKAEVELKIKPILRG
jgi:hypothetical protein